jgi:DUF1680 family protein
VVALLRQQWVAAGAFSVKVNGSPIAVATQPSSYPQVRRLWQDGDRVEVELPMQTTLERTALRRV